MVCVTRDALKTEEYRLFSKVNTNLSKSDIATIVDIFESLLNTNSSNDIEDVYTDNDGHFLFLLNSRGNDSSFDFYEFLNKWYSEENFIIDCINVKHMFPRTLSNGEYFYSKGSEESTTDMEDDDAATGYIDEDDLRELQSSKVYRLEYVKSGAEIKISDKPVAIGRSARESDFVIQNNKNISRRHCLVYTRGGVLYVKDNKSLNGTFVNDMKLGENIEEELHEGDTLYVADEKFVVR